MASCLPGCITIDRARLGLRTTTHEAACPNRHEWPPEVRRACDSCGQRDLRHHDVTLNVDGFSINCKRPGGILQFYTWRTPRTGL